MQRLEIGGVQKTLLLPLWGRAVESKKPKSRLVDETAVRIIGEIDYDFSTIAAGMSVVTQMAWVVRSLENTPPYELTATGVSVTSIPSPCRRLT